MAIARLKSVARTEETYTAGENLAINVPVYINPSGQVKKVDPILPDIYNDFNARIMASCKLGEGQIVLAYTDGVTGGLNVRTGVKAGNRIEWSGDASVTEEEQPSSFDVCPFGEGGFVLITQYGEAMAGHAFIGTIPGGTSPPLLGLPGLFSTENVATDMSCCNIDGFNHVAVSFRDGGDGLGYTKIGSAGEGAEVLTWLHTWNHGLTEAYENRLCRLGYDEGYGSLFAVVYRRAINGPYKLYFQIAGFDPEGAGFAVISTEKIAAYQNVKEVRVSGCFAEEGLRKIILAYVDIDNSGQGIVRVGNCDDILNPSFNEAHKLTVCKGRTGAIQVGADYPTMAQTFYMAWINKSEGNRLEYNMYYFENNLPTSNVGSMVVDYWPTTALSFVSFSYQGILDAWIGFTIPDSFDIIFSYNISFADFFQQIKMTHGVTCEAKNNGEDIKVSILGQINPFINSSQGRPAYIWRTGIIQTEWESPFPIGYYLNAAEMLVTKTPKQ